MFSNNSIKFFKSDEFHQPSKFPFCICWLVSWLLINPTWLLQVNFWLKLVKPPINLILYNFYPCTLISITNHENHTITNNENCIYDARYVYLDNQHIYIALPSLILSYEMLAKIVVLLAWLADLVLCWFH